MHIIRVLSVGVMVFVGTGRALAVLTAERFQAIRLIEDVYNREGQPDPNRKDGHYRAGGISNDGDLFGDAIWDQDPEHREHFEQPVRWLRSTGYAPEIVNGGQKHILHPCCGGEEGSEVVPGETHWGLHSGELRATPSRRHRGVTPDGIAIGDLHVRNAWIYLYDIKNDILTTMVPGKPTGTNAHGLVTATWSSCCGSHGTGYYSKVLDVNASQDSDPKFEVAAWRPTFGPGDPFPFAINNENIIVGNVGSIFDTERQPMKMLPTGENTWSDPIVLEDLESAATEGGALIAQSTVLDISNNADRPFGAGVSGSHGIVWDIEAGTVAADFGTLTEVWQISGDGTKVAGLRREFGIPPREIPTVWSTDDGWNTFTELDLNAALDPELALSGSALWVELTDIDGVNDAGQVVGIGMVQDETMRQAVFLLDTLPLEHVVLKGDVNNDGMTNNLDITPFVIALSVQGDEEAFGRQVDNGNFAAADANMDGAVNNLDITTFINRLAAGASAVPEPTTLTCLVGVGLALVRLRL